MWNHVNIVLRWSSEIQRLPISVAPLMYIAWLLFYAFLRCNCDTCRKEKKVGSAIQFWSSSFHYSFIRLSISQQNPCKSIWRAPGDLCKMSTFECCRILSHVLSFRSQLGSSIHCRSASKDGLPAVLFLAVFSTLPSLLKLETLEFTTDSWT